MSSAPVLRQLIVGKAFLVASVGLFQWSRLVLPCQINLRWLSDLAFALPVTLQQHQTTEVLVAHPFQLPKIVTVYVLLRTDIAGSTLGFTTLPRY